MELPIDSHWMDAALAEARSALFRTSPNPRVGCVIVSGDGRLAGRGSTQRAGGAHAEVMALRDAQARGVTVVGGTAYVTLEPCSHHGRTAPCCDALVQSGISRVVASIADPNPLVAGQGFAKLRAAGVVVDVGPGSVEARDINLGFFSRMLRGVPWVRMKAAASLDGVTALDNGVSQWITGNAARADGHVWRAQACTLLTGIGTVLADDPRLNVRLSQPVEREPSIAVVDSHLRIPLDASIFIAKRPCYIFTSVENGAKIAALEQQGAQVICLPGAAGKVDLKAMLRELARLGTNELHLEAGAQLNGAFVRERLVDELLLYLAPRLLGEGRGIAACGPISSLVAGLELKLRSVTPIDEDLRLLARVVGSDHF